MFPYKMETAIKIRKIGKPKLRWHDNMERRTERTEFGRRLHGQRPFAMPHLVSGKKDAHREIRTTKSAKPVFEQDFLYSSDKAVWRFTRKYRQKDAIPQDVAVELLQIRFVVPMSLKAGTTKLIQD